jgi:hypothetical protein
VDEDVSDVISFDIVLSQTVIQRESKLSGRSLNKIEPETHIFKTVEALNFHILMNVMNIIELERIIK